MSRRDGKKAAMREAIARAEGEVAAMHARAGGDQGELPDLFPVPTTGSAEYARMLQLAVRRRQGTGRPKGAQNAGTKEFRDYLLRHGVSPLEAMMRWALHTPITLAAELGCSPLEAFDRLKALWAELAPYLHQRMPLAVQVDQRTAGVLVLGQLTPDHARALGDQLGVAGLRLVGGQIEQNQEVSGDDAEQSHGGKSHDDATG